MISNLKRVRAGVGSALLACGAAGLLATTGCSSGSTSSSASIMVTSAAPSAPATVKPSSSGPSWAAALGTGITVIPPGTATPGNGSPDAVLAGVLQAFKDKSAAEYCGYAQPSAQAQCKSAFSSMSAFPSAKNLGPGYIVVDGTKAVVGMTGTVCAAAQASCVTNNDPAAVFTTLHTFSALWKNAVTPSGAKYSLNPLAKINGTWYLAS
jgi:hypothetical protein